MDYRYCFIYAKRYYYFASKIILVMAYSTYTLPIEKGNIYHIFNHAVGKERPFSNQDQCLHLLQKIELKLPPVCDIYAYVLIPDHFHLMVRITGDEKAFSRAFAELMISHSKWYNVKYKRMGGLFMKPFKRRIILMEDDITWVPWYIHRNPLHHQLKVDWRDYKWSSYCFYANSTPSFLKKDFLISHFGGLEKLIAHHELNATEWECDLEL